MNFGLRYEARRPCAYHRINNLFEFPALGRIAAWGAFAPVRHHADCSRHGTDTLEAVIRDSAPELRIKVTAGPLSRNPDKLRPATPR